MENDKGADEMNFHEFGDKSNPHIMMIHGGGNAWWNYLRQARELSKQYHVILPTLDGHGEEFQTNYISTEDSANKLVQYIDDNCNGQLFCLCGVSLGGQIVAEILSQRPNITQKAIIDGSLCYPKPFMAKYCIAFVKLFGGKMFSETSSKRTLAMLRKMLPKMQFPKEIEDYYIQDMPRLRKETLYTMYRTYMAEYHLKESIRNTKAQVMYWYGSREMASVKKSAQMFKQLVPTCEIYEAKGYNHGYLAVYLPEEWLEVARPFLES